MLCNHSATFIPAQHTHQHHPHRHRIPHHHRTSQQIFTNHNSKLTANMKNAPILALLTLASQVFANCDCGYRYFEFFSSSISSVLLLNDHSINRIDTDKFGLFTHIMETDFPHAKKTNLAVHSNVDSDWITEEHNKTAKELGTKFGTSMQTGNVLVNPLPDGQWGGQPDTAAAPGLQLWVRHAVDKDRIPIAAVNVNQFLRGKNRGMHYGSFRAAIKFSGMNGTRGAFIWKSKTFRWSSPRTSRGSLRPLPTPKT
jgi:hypothetical protein